LASAIQNIPLQNNPLKGAATYHVPPTTSKRLSPVATLAVYALFGYARGMDRNVCDISAKNGIIICLVGFPGVGKLTIVRALSGLIDATIVDNHWINDPILQLLRQTDTQPVPDAVWPQIAKVRGAVLETIASLSPSGANFIFTYAGSNEDPEDRRAFEEYREVATRRNARFVAVRLLCGEAELVRRIQSPERRGRKLMDPREAIENVRDYSPLDPGIPGSMTLDVTDLSGEAAAARILDHIHQRTP
jgi:energy-coupling factor transporter ATP-binding protein EcfA2